ncbi:MAG TPA: hypothetical protein ENI44_04465, partial [Thermoplasmatales archaeon]|nr:hypothetical protein [Thermoplasmatales archaeon]
MNRKALSIGGAFILVSLLFLQAGALASVDQGTNTQKLVFPGATQLPLKVHKFTGDQKTTNAGNILVSVGSDVDDTHPQITRDGSGNIIVAFTQEYDIMDSRMAWSYSQDAGQTWTVLRFTDPRYDIFNDIAWVDGPTYTGLWGVGCD